MRTIRVAQRAIYEMNMNDWNLKQELYYWYAEARAQLTGNWKWRKIASGLSQLKAHIQTEREKMTKTLWVTTMKRDRWLCKIHHHPICVFQASQVDHIIPLGKYGRTIESNLQAACAPCNRWKGTKII